MTSPSQNLDSEQKADLKSAKKRKKVGFRGDASSEFCEAKDCIRLHLINDETLREEDGSCFPPAFVDEFFEGGKIYGYQGLKIDIWLHASMFIAYSEVHYDTKQQINGSRKATKDVEVILKEIFGDSLVTDRATFIERLATAHSEFRDLVTTHGEVVSTWESDHAPSSFTTTNMQGHSKICEIVRMEINDPSLQVWRASLSPLILLFVEGGRPIDDDPQWEIFVALERPKSSNSGFKVTGLSNVFRFYHYPDGMRLRISQILVLPPYQRQGYGFQLLKAINESAVQRHCFDVNMEDPSEKLQELRDCVDTLRLLSNPEIVSAVMEGVACITENKNNIQMKGVEQMPIKGSGHQKPLHDGEKKDKKSPGFIRQHGWHLLTPPMTLIDVARKVFKINKAQFKRCWEILIFFHINPLDTDALEICKQLLLSKLKAEIFEKDKQKPGASKEVIDTKNEHDSSKTFIMIRVKNSQKDTSGVVHEVLADMEDTVEVEEVDKTEVLQELLKERDDEILCVLKKVREHLACKLL